MKLDKKKARSKLKLLSWEDLDWIEQAIRRLKPTAQGPRVYHSSGDATHVREAASDFIQTMDDVLEKHHPGG